MAVKHEWWKDHFGIQKESMKKPTIGLDRRAETNMEEPKARFRKQPRSLENRRFHWQAEKWGRARRPWGKVKISFARSQTWGILIFFHVNVKKKKQTHIAAVRHLKVTDWISWKSPSHNSSASSIRSFIQVSHHFLRLWRRRAPPLINPVNRGRLAYAGLPSSGHSMSLQAFGIRWEGRDLQLSFPVSNNYNILCLTTDQLKRAFPVAVLRNWLQSLIV